MNKPKRITSVIWPDKHKQILLKMHGEGASAAEIAAVLGRTKNSIIGFIHRSGLSNSRPKTQIKAKKPEFTLTEKPKQLFVKPIIEVEAPKFTGGVLFIFSNARQCKYITDHPTGLDTRVCGKKTQVGHSWCAEHHALVYNTKPVYNMRGLLHG